MRVALGVPDLTSLDKSADTFFTSLGKLGTAGSSIVDKVRVRS